MNRLGTPVNGFTVIEVMLFLAISGLLVLIAFAGVSTNINNTRFNDAVRSTESYLQAQYNEVLTGRNDRATNQVCNSSTGSRPGNSSNETKAIGTTNCVVLGRNIVISGDTITSRYVTGYTSNIAVIAGEDTTAIGLLRPQIAPQNVYEDVFQIPWKINTYPSQSNSSPISIAILRSPSTGNINIFTGYGSANTVPTQSAETSICFSDGSIPISRYGRVNLKAGQGQEIIQSDLTDTARATCRP